MLVPSCTKATCLDLYALLFPELSQLTAPRGMIQEVDATRWYRDGSERV